MSVKYFNSRNVCVALSSMKPEAKYCQQILLRLQFSTKPKTNLSSQFSAGIKVFCRLP